jgi:hypothetical protein
VVEFLRGFEDYSGSVQELERNTSFLGFGYSIGRSSPEIRGIMMDVILSDHSIV